jgi:hypothetical protein
MSGPLQGYINEIVNQDTPNITGARIAADPHYKGFIAFLKSHPTAYERIKKYLRPSAANLTTLFQPETSKVAIEFIAPNTPAQEEKSPSWYEAPHDRGQVPKRGDISLSRRLLTGIYGLSGDSLTSYRRASEIKEIASLILVFNEAPDPRSGGFADLAGTLPAYLFLLGHPKEVPSSMQGSFAAILETFRISVENSLTQ